LLQPVLRPVGRREPPRAPCPGQPPAPGRRARRRGLDRAELPPRRGRRAAALQLRRRARGRARDAVRPRRTARAGRARHPPGGLPRPSLGRLTSMPTVVLSAFEVARFERAPGHLWVYLQYVDGLRQAGCDVWWLERVPADRPVRLAERLAPFGLADRLLLYREEDGEHRWVDDARERADDVIARADLLLNFHYGIDARLLARFRRTALVDIDPGLLQIWLSGGQLAAAPHDLYFT